MGSDEQWDLYIKPKRGLFEINFREIWRYRDLLLLLVRRDFAAQYKQTILGPLWHLIQPLLTTIMFLLIFGRIAKIPTDGIHPVLFYMSGITMWNYFSTSLTGTANSFTSNANIFGKVYFPRIIMPMALVLSNLVRFGIQFFLLLVVMTWHHFQGESFDISFNWLWIPVLLAMMAGITLGLGIIFSSLTTKYRDFAVLLTFAVQLGMYATPIVYPMSYIKGSPYEYLIKLNPLTSLIEAFRYALFSKGTFQPEHLLYSFGFMMVVFVIGFLIFNRVEKSFMDTV